MLTMSGQLTHRVFRDTITMSRTAPLLARAVFTLQIRKLQDPKPYKSWEQQLQLIADRFSISGLGEQYLKSNNYFRLSGYWFPMRELVKPRSSKDSTGREIRAESFSNAYSFDQVQELYEWEAELRTLLFGALGKIELALRSQVAHQLGKHNPFAHCFPELFLPKFNRKAKLSKRLKFLYENRRIHRTDYEQWLRKISHSSTRHASSDDAIKHQLEKYGNVHIWSLVEILEFNTVVTAFANLKQPDSVEIAKFFGYTAKHVADLRSQLEALNNLRNKIAHHSRIWNRNFSRAPKIPSNLTYPFFEGVDSRIPHNKFKLFPLVCSLVFLLHQIEQNWHSRDNLRTHFDSFPKTGPFDLAGAGFPANWRELPLWATT